MNDLSHNDRMRENIETDTYTYVHLDKH